MEWYFLFTPLGVPGNSQGLQEGWRVGFEVLIDLSPHPVTGYDSKVTEVWLLGSAIYS